MANYTNRLKLFSMKTQVINSYTNAGLTLRELGIIHNCSANTIRNFLDECGVSRRRPGRVKTKPRIFHERVKMPTE